MNNHLEYHPQNLRLYFCTVDSLQISSKYKKLEIAKKKSRTVVSVFKVDNIIIVNFVLAIFQLFVLKNCLDEIGGESVVQKCSFKV